MPQSISPQLACRAVGAAGRPGDPGETAVGAALRELDEEVGIWLSESAVLGLLDDSRHGRDMSSRRW